MTGVLLKFGYMREIARPHDLLVVADLSRDRREPPDLKRGWQSIILSTSLFLNAELLNQALGDKLRGSFPTPDPRWVKEVKKTGELEGRIFLKLWNLESGLAGIDDSQDPAAVLAFVEHRRKRQECLEGLVEKVKTTKPLNVPATMALHLLGKIREREGGELGVLVRRMMLNDLVAVWLMAGDKENFLVGTKGGIFWKNLRFGALERIKDVIRSGAPTPPEEVTDALRDVFNNGPQYLVNLAHVGQRELNLVPERPIAQPEEAGLHFPIPGESVEELLEDAFHKQRFLAPPEGAWVQLQDAGDLKKMFVLQKGDIFVARIITTKGDFLAGLNLETAERYDYLGDFGISRDEEFFPNVLKILAGVYHDLVTVEELPPGNGRLMRGTRAIGPGREGAKEPRPRVVYIPRRVGGRREGNGQLTRPRYEGPRRPVKPHEVGGFARRARMTEGHKSVLEEFERKTGIRVLELVAQINAETGEPHTYVRPHVRGEGLPEAPVFIQRRVRKRLAERIEQQIESARAKTPSS